MAIDVLSELSPWSEESLRGTAFHRNGILLGCGAPGSLQGFVLAATMFDQAEIFKLAVHPNYRRAGVGSILLAACCAELRTRGVDTAYLEVRESNAAARSLYEKFGFTVHMLRRGYYQPDGESAVVYLRSLFEGSRLR